MVIKLKNVRIAFCQDLHTAGTFKGDDTEQPAWSSTFILEKDDPQITEIVNVMKKVAKEKWKEDAKEIYNKLVKKGDVCLHDGDDKDEYDGFAGNRYIAARLPDERYVYNAIKKIYEFRDQQNFIKPIVIDENNEILTEASGKPYAGCYVHASVDIWAQENKWGKRINAKLRGVKFYRDGEPFSGSAPADVNEFDDLDDVGDGEDDLL